VLLTTIPEAVDIILQTIAVGIYRRIHTLHALNQKSMVVNTLRTRENLLSTHMEIIGVGIAGFARGHSVERTNGEWVLIEDVKVGAVLFEDEFSQLLLLRSAIRVC